MNRLDRAVNTPTVAGAALPDVFAPLAGAGIRFRRSELTMVAGQPQCGKSLFALWHAIAWVTEGLRGLYFSADSALLTQAQRALAMSAVGVTATEAEQAILDHAQWATDALGSLSSLAWAFDNDLTYESLDAEVSAFDELWGTLPDFIIVDNLTDVDGQAEDEWAAQRRVLKGLASLARHTDAAVIVLHHTTEDPRIRNEPCPPRWAIQGKCSQKPAVILTLASQGTRRPVACVKNRGGRSDFTGRTAYDLWLDTDTLHWRAA